MSMTIPQLTKHLSSNKVVTYDPLLDDIFDRFDEEDCEDDDDKNDPATSYPSSWKDPFLSSAISHSFVKPSDGDEGNISSGAVQSELKPKPKVFNISFDVSIGNPARVTRKIWINNAQGKSIYLAPYRNIIQLSLELFNNNIRAAHHNSLPRFMIYSGGTSSAVMKEVELVFYGLYFDDNKIKASFLYFNEDSLFNDDVMRFLNEIGETCNFYIVGEFEMDDTEEHIIGMEIESFDYFNPIV